MRTWLRSIPIFLYGTVRCYACDFVKFFKGVDESFYSCHTEMMLTLTYFHLLMSQAVTLQLLILDTYFAVQLEGQTRFPAIFFLATRQFSESYCWSNQKAYGYSKSFHVS